MRNCAHVHCLSSLRHEEGDASAAAVGKCVGRVSTDRIKLCMGRVMETPCQTRIREYAEELSALLTIFPHSSMSNERQRLKKEKAK